MFAGLGRLKERLTYDFKAVHTIERAFRPVRGEEERNLKVSLLRGAQRRTAELREAFTTPKAGIAGWVAPGGPIAADVLGRFVFPVPEAIRVPIDQGVRLVFAKAQRVAYGRDNTIKQVKELEDLQAAKRDNDLILSGEFRLALQLRYLDRQYERLHPEEGEQNKELGRIIQDPQLLAFARERLDALYDNLNTALKAHHPGRRGRNMELGDDSHPILTTRAVLHEDLKGVQGKFDAFFDGPTGATMEGEKKTRPVHEAILSGLRNPQNEKLRLQALEGASTAASNFINTLVGNINRRISANRWSEAVNGAQILFGWVASVKFYGGLLETVPIAYTAGLALATTLSLPLWAAFGFPILTAGAIVLATYMSTRAGISRIANKWKRNSFARVVRKDIKETARQELYGMKKMIDPEQGN